MTTAILALVAFLAIADPITQGILTAIQVGVTTDQSIAWRADGCPVHRWDGTLAYMCKKTTPVVKK